MYTQPVKRNKDYDVLLATLSTAVRAMGFIKKSKKINYPKIKTQIFVTFNEQITFLPSLVLKKWFSIFNH